MHAGLKICIVCNLAGPYKTEKDNARLNKISKENTRFRKNYNKTEGSIARAQIW